jgi:hypothetical protein
MGQLAQNQKPLPEFELARKRLRQQATARGQEQEQAIKRQFARTGMLSSGAAIKTLQRAKEQTAKQEQQALEGIGAAEAAERRRLGEIKAEREFRAAEAEKGRTFAREEAGIQREFVKGESALQRAFAKEEAQEQRGFAAGEAEKQRSFQQGLATDQLQFQKMVFKQEVQDRLKQFEEQKKQFSEQMAFEKDVANFNKWVAQQELNQPTDLMGSMFGSTFSLQPGRGPIGNVLGAVTKPFCHLAGTEVLMENLQYKNIEDIKLGERVYGGGKITGLGQAYTDDDIFEYKGEMCTGSHIMLDGDKFIAVRESKDAKLVDIGFKNIVYPLDTENKFYVTKGGYASISYTKVEDAFDPESELRALNQNSGLKEFIKDSLLRRFNNKIEVKQFKETDYNILKKWFRGHNWAIMPRDQIPVETSFLVYTGGVPVAFSSYYKSNSSLALMGSTISDPGSNRSIKTKALSVLYDHVLQHSKSEGFNCLYYATDRHSLPVVRAFKCRGGKITSKGDGYIMIVPLNENVNTKSLEDKDYFEEVG